jgi:carboxyl-terminal processing protease
MFRYLANALVAVVACLSLATPAPAGTTHAIIVGVGQFADAQIQPRKFAEADAQALYDVLVKPEYLGAPADNIRLLLAKEDDKRHAKPATKDNILAAVKDVVAKAAKDDLVIVAIFGRGAILADRTCFFTADATVKDRAKSALATADLEQELQAFKGDKLVAFIDVNYKGIDPGEEKLLEPSPLDLLRVFIGAEDKEEHTVPPGRVVFLGNANITPAIDLEEHGLFAQVILDGLKGAADKDGYEADGNITVDELDAYIDANLIALARKAGKSKEEILQTPFDWGGRLNTFVLTHNPAVTPKVKERITKLAELKLPAERAAEGEKLLAKMPKLKADQELRKLYQQLADGSVTSEKFETARGENAAARRMSVDDAQQFARKTMDGLLIVKSGYYKDQILAQMTSWAVKGMYRRLDEKTPDEIKDKLDKIKDKLDKIKDKLDAEGLKTDADRRERLEKLVSGEADFRRARMEELLADVRQRLGKREDLDEYKDVDLAISQMMLNLDYPYTTYIDSESKKKSETEFLGRFTGIGIQIRRDLVRDGLLVVSPIKGSPAYKAGLLAGDLITEVITDMSAQGKPMKETETVSTRGMKTEDAIKRILGDPNTKITVKVEREGAAQPLLIDINRAQVNVETVMGTKRLDDDEWEFMLDPKDKIGYIRLTQFTHKSASDMEAAVKKLAREGVKGLVLDLRFNPGGLLDSAVEITDLFVDDGLIVSIRPRVGRERAFAGTHDGSFLNFPMVCLVNGSSASGSEIVAAALQDHQRAVIIGERSYGKGSVQTIHQFRPTEAEIKMTTATFWRPNGKNLNKPSTNGSESEDWGVRPDAGYELKLDRKESSDLFERLRDQEIIARRDVAVKEKPVFTDRQLEKGLEYLRSQLRTASAGPTKKAG